MDIKNAEAIYALSPVQEAVLIESLNGQDSKAVCGQWSCTLEGALDARAFERAWQQEVSCHSILRAFFVWKRLERPLQVVRKQLDFSVEQQSWLGLSPAEQQERLAAFLQADGGKMFDPSEPPLIRVVLCRTSADTHRLICIYHRLVLDEWSLRLIVKRVLTSYQALTDGQAQPPSSCPPLRNYLAWLKEQDMAEAETFWRNTLRGFTAPTPLIVERPPDGLPDREDQYRERQTRLSAEATATLRSWASEHHLSLNTLVYGMWALLLSRYSDEENVVFGLTTSGRPPNLPGSELIVGRFMTTLPMRVRMPPDAQVLAWLKELEARQAILRRYAYSSPAQVKGWSEMPDELPLFESSVDLDTPADDLLPGQDASLSVGHIQSLERLDAPLTLRAQFGSECVLRLIYDSRRFDDEMIGNMLEQAETILESIITRPEQPLSNVSILSESALRQILVEWNDTKTDPRHHDRCLHQLFEAQVERTPDTLAIIFEDQQLTYRELNGRANQLAHYLQQLGVSPGVMVGLCVARSPEMVVGMLAVMKAGGAYVPLDPSYPFERLAYMLADAQPPVLLTQERLAEGLPSYEGQVIRLDADRAIIARENTENLDLGLTSDELAYMIYTSGSTGRPKGVMVPHRGVSNSSAVYARVIDMPAGSRMLQLTSIGFDMSVFDIVPALISGLTLCLAPQTPPLGTDLLKVLEEQQIEIISFPPSILATLPPVELPALRFIGVAGEAISAELIAQWSAGRRLYDAYGPAEGSIWVCGAFLDESRKPIIGRAIDNIELYVLDKRLRPVPVGVAGELCIGGIGVTWGYWRQAELTAQKYVPHPFSEEGGKRLYRTGDLARHLGDGNLEFLGRTDSQVKIRGARIELGEVEAVLGSHPEVREAVVVAREEMGGEKRLVAYIHAHENQSPTTSSLRSYLKQKLPETMIPSTFVVVEALPLSPNGKVDRQALPAPEMGRPALEESFVAPRNEVEEALAKIWVDVLRLERVGVYDNFFELGGHSLLATQVVSRVRAALQVDISLPQLFEAPTIATLSKVIEEIMGNHDGPRQAPIVPVSRETHRISRSVLELPK